MRSRISGNAPWLSRTRRHRWLLSKRISINATTSSRHISMKRSQNSPAPELTLKIPSQLRRAVTEMLRTVSPLPKLTISEWADRYRRLSSESSAEPGQWMTRRAEYQRGIVDAISEPGVEHDDRYRGPHAHRNRAPEPRAGLCDYGLPSVHHCAYYVLTEKLMPRLKLH